MRESRTYGSVRGAGSNLRPYRDRFARWAKVVDALGYAGRALKGQELQLDGLRRDLATLQQVKYR